MLEHHLLENSFEHGEREKNAFLSFPLWSNMDYKQNSSPLI